LTTAYLVGALALGVIMSILLAGWVAFRRYEASLASPWENPRTPYVATLKQYCIRAAYDHEEVRFGAGDPRAHVAPVHVLRLGLIRDGVVLFQDGEVVHPDGSRLEFNAAVLTTIETVQSAYAALHEAAELLTAYADTFSPAELLSHPSETMRSIAGQYAKYPLQHTIIRVAQLLGADANSDEVGAGGTELWRRNLQRLNRPRTDWPTASAAHGKVNTLYIQGA